MSKPKILDYAYAVGRVRALEKNLIARAVFQEAAESPSLANAMKILMDAGSFREERVEFQDSLDLDRYLEKERQTLIPDMEALFLEKTFVSILRDRTHPRGLLASADSLDCPFVRDYVRHLLDIKNLKLFLRARYLELPREKIIPQFLKGGFVDILKFSQNYESTLAEVGELLHASAYQGLWARAVDTLITKGTFADLERGSEDFMMRYLRKARQIVFGPEPVFAFALARLKELELVRLIGVGKLIGIPAEVLKSRICETYV